MQSSLSGQGVLKIVGHVSSDPESQAETALTLDFVQNAREAMPKVCFVTHGHEDHESCTLLLLSGSFQTQFELSQDPQLARP